MATCKYEKNQYLIDLDKDVWFLVANKDDEALLRREKDDFLQWKAIHAINRYFKPVSYEMAKALYMELEEKALKGAKGDTNAQSSEVQEQKDL